MSGPADALTISLLDELARRWHASDAPIAHALEPGLSEEAMSGLAARVGLVLPPEARTLWGWRNGAERNFMFGGGGHAFGSLQHAIEDVEMMRRIAVEVADPYGRGRIHEEIARSVWNRDWLPLARDSVGGMLVIDAGPGSRNRSTSAVAYRAKDDGSTARPVADSIAALVRKLHPGVRRPRDSRPRDALAKDRPRAPPRRLRSGGDRPAVDAIRLARRVSNRATTDS